MPLKLSVATSRKVGEPNYGSRGATVGLEMEVDSSLVDQPRQLHDRISRLFRLAKQSVEHELGSATVVEGINHGLPKGNRLATDRQIRAIHAIAARGELDLHQELRSRFNVDCPEDLSLEQASQLIDAIKSLPDGTANPT